MENPAGPQNHVTTSRYMGDEIYPTTRNVSITVTWGLTFPASSKCIDMIGFLMHHFLLVFNSGMDYGLTRLRYEVQPFEI